MTLVEQINKYWDSHVCTHYDEYGGWFDTDADDDGKNLVDRLFEELFKDGGHWNYETKEQLQNAGYRCWVGDGDSFGILVAVITKDERNLSVG